jgi:ABC-type branched-subunit amino acid transport system substrate-binding protein
VRARAVLNPVVALVALLAVTGCTAPATAPTATPEPTAVATPSGDGVLRIGTILPTSGTFAFLGPAQVAGVEVAVREINELGGVAGVPVEVLHRDSGEAGTSTAEDSFRDLVAQGADVIVGPTSSAIAQRLVPLALQAHVPFISPAATFPGLMAVADTGFAYRTIPGYDLQGAALAQELAGKRVALVAVDDELGRSLAAVLQPALEERGGELVEQQFVAASGADPAGAIAAARDAQPDALVVASAYSSFDLTKAMISQSLGAGFGAGRLWLTTQNTGDYNQAFPPGTLNGVNGVIDGVPPDDAFIGRLKSVDGNLSQFRYSQEAYDATVLAALAAIAAADDAGTAIASRLGDVSAGGVKCTLFAECAQALRTVPDIDYDGRTGPVDFTVDGDVSAGAYGVYAYDGDNKFVLQRTVVAALPEAP